MRPVRYLSGGGQYILLVLGMLVYLSGFARAQTWSWTTETVDSNGGTFSALAVDSDGNVHAGYLSPGGGGTKYAFRSAASGKWFTMLVDKSNGYVNIALDGQQHPHLCYFAFQTLKYARFDGSKWLIQEIAPGSGERDFSCSIAIGPHGAPHVTWYQYSDVEHQLYLHIRHAVLKDGRWLARTLDLGRETGKWNSVRVDSAGRVYVAYSAFRDRALRCATADLKGTWSLATVEGGSTDHEGTTPGMGNSMVLDKNGRPNFSFRDELTLRYAWPEGDHWRIDVVDENANPSKNMSWIGLRTSLALDTDGHPHIAYETVGTLKHAWWDGQRWHIQPMGIGGPGLRYASLAISRDDVIYMGYSDPEDGSFKVLVGRPVKTPTVAQKAERAHK